MVDIPPDFQRDVLQGRHPEIQVNIDATQMTQAYIGAGYIQHIVHGELQEFMRRAGRVAELPVRLVTRVLFNPNLSGVWFGGVMEVINQVTLLSIILTGAAVIREREHGTLEHLMVMPLSPFQIMAAKVWANGLVVLVAAFLYVESPRKRTRSLIRDAAAIDQGSFCVVNDVRVSGFAARRKRIDSASASV